MKQLHQRYIIICQKWRMNIISEEEPKSALNNSTVTDMKIHTLNGVPFDTVLQFLLVSAALIAYY